MDELFGDQDPEAAKEAVEILEKYRNTLHVEEQEKV